MTYYIRNGNSFRPTPEAALDIQKVLPAGTFIIKQIPMSDQLYFEQVDDFSLGGKLYGDTVKNCERIIATYNDRPGSTGVLLSGEKGSGKTLLAKLVATRAREAGMPTIVINSPWAGDSFNQLIQGIQQDCVLIFDEFEKVYDEEHQEAILTLLDGVFSTKKLVLLTCNDKWRINEHMRNRPGRIFYMLEFHGLTQEFISEYCQENLQNKTRIQSVMRAALLFNEFNFDMLKALVEEMNRYDEDAVDSLRILNIKPNADRHTQFKIQLTIDGVIINDVEHLSPETFNGNPVMTPRIVINYNDKLVNPPTPKLKKDDDDGDDDDDDDYEWTEAVFTASNLVKDNAANGTFTYVNDRGEVLVLTRIRQDDFAYAAWL